METLFPTGLRIEFPSGVNIILPCLYTVPNRFENYNTKEKKIIINTEQFSKG